MFFDDFVYVVLMQFGVNVVVGLVDVVDGFD